MDIYDPATVFSSIDHGSLRLRQPAPHCAWNLARLTETLLPLLSEDRDAAIASAQDALSAFGPRFDSAYLAGLRRKIGLETTQDGDDDLTQDLLKRMAEGQADFTLTFRRLATAARGGDYLSGALFSPGAAYDGWAEFCRARLAKEPGDPAATMLAVNPLYIPRNHLVEAALNAATAKRRLRPVRGPPRRHQPPLQRAPRLAALHSPTETRGARPANLLRHLATACGRRSTPGAYSARSRTTHTDDGRGVSAEHRVGAVDQGDGRDLAVLKPGGGTGYGEACTGPRSSVLSPAMAEMAIVRAAVSICSVPAGLATAAARSSVDPTARTPWSQLARHVLASVIGSSGCQSLAMAYSAA